MNDVIPQYILDKANNEDIYLKDGIEKDRYRVAIFYENLIVGFFQPFKIRLNNKLYWRTGNIYILPTYRRKGLGSKAITEFFKDKENGVAFIDTDNLSSIRAFEKSGFVKDKDYSVVGNRGVTRCMMIKDSTISLEALPAYIQW